MIVTCPNCGRHIKFSDNLDEDYCPNCGMKIWLRNSKKPEETYVKEPLREKPPQDRKERVFLWLSLILLLSSLAASFYFIMFQTERFATSPLLKMLIYFLPISALILWLIGKGFSTLDDVSTDEFDTLKGWIFGLLVFSIFWYILSPGVLSLRSEKLIERYLNNIDLSESVSSWMGTSGNTSTVDSNLTRLSPVRSAIIVEKRGSQVKISDKNELLKNDVKAVGPKSLKYVLLIKEENAGETLSEKWQAYYAGFGEVGKPFPVIYQQIDYHLFLVDINTRQVLSYGYITADPPNDYSKPLDSTVRIYPSDEQLLQWLGYKDRWGNLLLEPTDQQD